MAQDIIRLLPDALANQIAAGEVVQRPASVVKELMENSIDAGSTSIDLIISNAGKSLIQVIDNGKGMSETDARMSFERHATSKIKATEDLFNIRTMGFRGEALASISAVAQVSLKTRKLADETGTEILIEASEVKFQEPCAAEPGTSISVKNLFYNVPARRNFLKSDGVELKHIIDEFQRIALANPEKSFNYIQDGEEVYRLSSGKLIHRIIEIFGKSYKDQLIPCEAETPELKLYGYIGKPESSKKTRGDQYVFVNNRFIRSSYLNHAIVMAFESLIPEKFTPFYTLYMEMDPSHLDINVHPTKTEIKFDDERMVYAVVRSTVKRALGAHNIYPTLDFQADVNLFHQFEQKPTEANQEQNYSKFQNIPSRPSTQSWEKLFDENLRGGDQTNRIIQQERTSTGVAQTFTSRLHEVEHNQEQKFTQFIQFQQSFILTPFKSSLMIVDQKAALERIVYDQTMARMNKQRAMSQQCLFPVSVELLPADLALLEEVSTEMKELGFDFESLGRNTVVIQGIPADIAIENEKELFEGLLEQYKNSKNDLEISKREQLIRALSKRTAQNHLKKMDTKEMEETINKLFASTNANYTPDGRPTFRMIERTTLESFFK